jgi:hypothetical protein
MKTIILFGLLSLFVSSASGQIEGVVIDKKRVAIPNVMIIVTDSTAKAIDTVKSDKRGGYFFKGLKPGKYNVAATASGFQMVIYKNIVTITAPEGTDQGNDTYYAVRVDIVLIPMKPQK